MIRQNMKFINYMRPLIDVAILSISFLVSSNIQTPLIERISIIKLIFIFIFSITLHLVLYLKCDLYKSHRNLSFIHEFNDIIKANLISYVIISVMCYIGGYLDTVYVSILFFFLTNNILITLYKFTTRLILKNARKKGYNQKFIIILGVNSFTNEFIKKIKEEKDLGYTIVGFFEDVDEKKNFPQDIKYMGSFDKFNSYIQKNIIDEVMVTINDDKTDKIKKAVEMCEIWGIKFSIIPNIFSMLPSRSYIDTFNGIPVINVRQIPLDNVFNLITKRVLDIVVSIISLIIFSPVMVFVAIIIKVTSEGPIIFKQKRVGFNRKEFFMYKFRSMRIETEKVKKFTTKNDDRCTPIGKFIRKYSIDELPQLINVLKGDMSLIGPRPEIPFFVENFRTTIPSYMLKHYIKPGMSGLAQVNGFRGDTSIEDRIKYDVYYIENWSLMLDIKILIKTAIVGIFNKNAY